MIRDFQSAQACAAVRGRVEVASGSKVPSPDPRAATTIVTGFDDTIRRISTAYDDHGRVSTVSSFDHGTPGSGSVLNEVAMQYDDWGNLAIFTTDPDSAIGAAGIGPYQVEHAYVKSAPSGARRTLRRDYSVYPGDASVDYTYASSSGLHDGNLSRVTQVDYQIGLNPRVSVAKYAYLGVGDLVGTEYPEPGMHSRQYGGTSGVYPDRDLFGRTTRTRWSKTSPSLDFVDLAISYDRNSNITAIADAVLGAGFDVIYEVDDLDRLIDAELISLWGTIVSSALTNRTRRQQWTLDQVGNWNNVQLDLNGDGLLTGTGELDETRTHNLANEVLTREPDSDPPPEFTFAHDAAGNMTDDGEEYTYEYDAWYRLVRIRNRSTTDLVAEYTYYGNGYRASSHHDTNLDGDVDGDDPVYYFAYDERWRIVATFRDDDTDPKERFLHHAAGMNGYGGSSYIDSIILRDRDADTDWDDESDGVLEERRYYCQSWRHDVVAIVTDDGKLAERARYSAYGVPYGIPLGDVNGDGTVDASDQGLITLNWGSGPVRYDLNLDGTVDAADAAIVTNEWGTTLGRGALSAIGNRRGYAGYEADFARDSIMHVRHRVYHAELGRWTRRDPLGYVDGGNLYGYVRGRPVQFVDPTGLASVWFYSAVPHNQNLKGQCGRSQCRADVVVSFEPRFIYPRVSLVAEIHSSDLVACCSPHDFPSTPIRRSGFFEDWGVVPANPGGTVDQGTHEISSPAIRRTSRGRMETSVRDVRMLLDTGYFGWQPPGSLPPRRRCGLSSRTHSFDWRRRRARRWFGGSAMHGCHRGGAPNASIRLASSPNGARSAGGRFDRRVADERRGRAVHAFSVGSLRSIAASPVVTVLHPAVHPSTTTHSKSSSIHDGPQDSQVAGSLRSAQQERGETKTFNLELRKARIDAKGRTLGIDPVLRHFAHFVVAGVAVQSCTALPFGVDSDSRQGRTPSQCSRRTQPRRSPLFACDFRWGDRCAGGGWGVTFGFNAEL